MKSSRRRSSRKIGILLIGAVLLLGLLLSQKGDLRQSLQALDDAKLGYVALALLFSALSFLPAALVYKCLAVHRLSYSETLIVQAASSFTNRLLPAGAGSLVTFAKYLIVAGHSTEQAAALVSVNNILGFVATVMLAGLVALASNTPLHQVLQLHVPAVLTWIIVGLLLMSLLILALSTRLRRQLTTFTSRLLRDFRALATKPWRLAGGLLAAMLITICYGAVLHASILAMGQSASVLQTFIVLIIGVATASITPTPGGIGGAEAGLVAALSSIGIAPQIGLDIALLYRAATFWLPIIPGIIFFRLAIHRKLL